MNNLAQRLTRCTLLVVEDSRTNTEMLRQQLTQAGFINILFAENGKRALEMTQELTPDLVILDMMMPEMDGFEYCKYVRAIPQFSAMPIIVQTALEQQDEKLRAFTMGASDYITKPVHGAELIARIKVHLLNKLLFEDVLQRERQMLTELRAAREMQQRLIPTTQRLETLQQNYGFDIATYFEPSSSLGGDCWGVWPISDHRMALHMFDFSGHGTAAAINVFRIHTLMRESSPHANNAGNFLTHLNQHLHPLIERNEFATMFYGVIDTKANTLEYAAAAAPPTLLYHGGKAQAEWLDIRGIPLGATANAIYKTITTSFTENDALVMFSDCLIETPDAKGEVISQASIVKCASEALAENTRRPAARTLEKLLEKFRAHSEEALRDDLTLNVYYRR